MCNLFIYSYIAAYNELACVLQRYGTAEITVCTGAFVALQHDGKMFAKNVKNVHLLTVIICPFECELI
jgi:hypothetical protein